MIDHERGRYSVLHDVKGGGGDVCVLSCRRVAKQPPAAPKRVRPALPSKALERKSLGRIKLYVNVAPLGQSESASATPLVWRRPPIGFRRDEGRGSERHQEGLGMSRDCIWRGGATRLRFLLGGKVKGIGDRC